MSVQILTGDCRDVLKTLPDQSVHCVVTSPPYFGLRDYGTGTWQGGDADCDHRSPTMREGRNEDRAKLAGSDATNSAQLLLAHRSACGKCGATKVDQQIGLEPTPDAFVATMVEVFRDVRRVLRDDGTLWLNLGDSYANDTKWGGSTSGKHVRDQHGDTGIGRRRQNTGLKSKDLIGIPWRVAFALQADGWYLRQDIIWHKPNPMPESVQDRCTKAHEYLFMLSKSARYSYDADAIKEPAVAADIGAMDGGAQRNKDGSKANDGRNFRPDKQPGHGRRHAGFNDRWDAMEKADQCSGTRNKRSVWTVATQPYSEAHFATFPPALIEPCILAGCPVGGTVLDPFGGAGTTALVADRLKRSAILIELNPKYAAMARKRLTDDAGMFAEVA